MSSIEHPTSNEKQTSDFYTPIERYSIWWYWVLGTGYWVFDIGVKR